METFSLANIFYWYWFLVAKKTIDFLNFIIVIFIFPILPYAIVAFRIHNESDVHKKNFYGDGSIMILCSGILCSFIAMLFEHRNDNEKKFSLFINLILIIVFILITLVFVDTQLNFARSWCDINWVLGLTTGILIFTLLAALYLNFRLRVDYTEVQNFIEEIRRKRIEEKAIRSNKSKGGTRV